jgi:transcriptional regulator with XRE-family HTH domain
MGVENPTGEIGTNIRSRRQALGLSLDALAKQSGVSSTMLSEVERSVKNPTVKLAYQIARALNCTLTDLLDERPPRAVNLIRADERRTLVDPATGVVRHGLSTDLLNHALEIAWYQIPPGESSGDMEPNRPGLVEMLIVIEGQLTVVLGGNVDVLGPGDSVIYGPQNTEYKNAGDEPCMVLLLSDATQVERRP